MRYIRIFSAVICLLSLSLVDSSPIAAKEKNPLANSDPIYVQLRSLGLSGEYVKVESLPLVRETARILLKQGEVHFLAPVGGKITGAVFTGEGEFQMTPFLSTEKQHMKWLTGADSISDHFDKLILRFTDNTAEELRQGRTVRTGAPNSSARDVLDSQRKLLRKGRKYSSSNVAMAYQRYNLDARILIDLISPGQSGLFWASFEGKRYGDLAFVIDPLGAPLVSPEEVALVGLSDSSLGIWSASHLQSHYSDGVPADDDHALIDQEYFKIEASAKGKRLDAVTQVRFKAMTDGLRVLPLDLFPTLRMQKVTDSQGRELAFVQEDKEEDADFSVILQEGMKKGEPYSLTFTYGGDDAVSDNGGGNYSLDARSNWYPNSGFGEDRANYEMTLRVPKDVTMVATGQPTGEGTEGGWNVSHWKTDVPLGVAGFNYGRFKKTVEKLSSPPFTIETYANRDIPDVFRSVQRMAEELDSEEQVTGTTLGSLNTISMMSKAMAEAKAAIGLYTQWFGPLPYNRLAMTQQPFPDFGQAWPMLVYMPISAFLDSTFRHQLGMGGGRSESFYRYVAAHEVSHQWWGHVLGWKSYRDQWLSEGFAQFSASLFAQAAYHNDAFLKFWKELRLELIEKNKYGKSPYEIGGVTMGYRLDTAKTGHVTSMVIYAKGAFILHMLRMMMWTPQSGDAPFFEILKDFVKSHFNEKVSTLDFQRCVEKHMTPGMDLDGNRKMDWFFNEWTDGVAFPEYKQQSRVEAGENGQSRLYIKVTQSNVDEAFKMRVPIYADINGKTVRLASVVLKGNGTTPEHMLALPARPEHVRLCAHFDVLCSTSE